MLIQKSRGESISLYFFKRIEKVVLMQDLNNLRLSPVMPVQPSVEEPEEEMEAGKESQLPQTNGELEHQRERERGEETMEESTEDRESDLDESEEQEEEESSGKSAKPLFH